MKKIITLTLFLAIISGLAGATLAFVYTMTDPIIEERKIAAVKATLEAIFPGADEYKEISFEDASGAVTNVYEAVGAGYAFNVSIQGYKDIITFIVGIDEAGEIVGFNVTYLNDTPGLGSKVGEPAFANTIIGSKVGDKVDTITGSTVSSAAIVKGIDAAVAVYQSLK